MIQLKIKRVIAVILIVAMLPLDSFTGCFPAKVRAAEVTGNQAEVSEDDMCVDVSDSEGEADEEMTEADAEPLMENSVSEGDSVIEAEPVNTQEILDTCGFTLTGNKVIAGDYCLTEGTLDLAGYTLTIRGDLIQAGGKVVLNDGRLNVGGDYRIQSRNGEEGAYAYGKSDGKLQMTGAEDYVSVQGSYISDSSADTTGSLTAGTLEVKGNVIVNNTYSANSFVGSGSHKLLLSGEGLQNIKIGGSTATASRVANLEITNESEEGVVFANTLYATGEVGDHGNKVSGTLGITSDTDFTDDSFGGNVVIGQSTTLSKVMVIDGNLSINSGLTVSGSVHVKGNVVQSGSRSSVYMNKGTLEVEGNYTLKNDYYTYLRMEHAEDYIHVHGNVEYNPSYAETYHLTAGTFEIGGNLTSGRGIYATGTHRFLFSGDKRQVISIAADEYFATIELQNYSEEGVYSATTFAKNKLIRNGCKLTYGDTEGEYGWTLSGDQIYEGDLVLMEDTLDLNGHTLTVTGDLVHASGIVKINGGQLLVQGDYRMQSRTGTEGAYAYGSSTGQLIMQQEEDKVTVLGSFLMNTTVSSKGKLTAGILEVQGNFTQSGGCTYEASGTNTLLFSGKKSQVWSHTTAPTLGNLVNRNSKRLTITTSPIITGMVTDEKKNMSGNGVIRISSSNQLTDGYCSGVVQITGKDTLETDIKVGGLQLGDGATLETGNHTIEAGSITLKGTLYVQDGRIVCTDYFTVDTNGLLVMRGADGNVLVGGDFKMISKHNHQGYLTEGILEIRGHFEQNSYVNFVATENHTVILSRKMTTAGKHLIQNVIFNYGAGTTRFNKLVLTKNIEGYYFKNEPEAIANEVVYDLEDDVPPTGVEILEATETTVTTVTLSYGGAEDSSGILGYEIYRDGVLVAVTGATTYTDIGLEPLTEYVYTVYPFDNYRNMAEDSPTITIMTKEDTEAPTVPGGLSISTRTGSAITLSWNAAKDNAGEVSYTLYRNGEILAGGLKETTYKDSGLEKNKAYKYCVAARDTTGNTSANSNVVEGVVAMPEITEVTPGDYSGIGGDKVSITVKFKNVGNAGGNVVKMEYAGEDGQWKLLAPGMLSQKSYNSTTLYVNYNWNISRLNGTYNIRYTLYDADRNTDVEEVTYQIDREAPKVPENLKALSEDGTIRLTWDASGSADCTYYKLYRKESEEEKYVLLTKLQDRYETTYVDSQVEVGKSYVYMLLAGDAFSNEGAYTEPVTVEVNRDMAAPEVNSILPKAGRIQGKTEISITAEDNRGVGAVRLEYKEEQAESWQPLAEISATDNGCTYVWDTTSLSDGVCMLRAIAVDTSGNESMKEFTRRYEVDNTGIAKMEITDYDISSTAVRLHWADVTESDFGYFRIEKLTGDTYVKVADVSSVLGYEVGGLLPNTEYTFRVVGYDNLGNRGIPSDPVSVTTIADTGAPVITGVYPVASCYRDKLTLQVKAQDNHKLGKAVFSYSTDKESFEQIAEVETDAKADSISRDFDISFLPEGKLYIKFEVYDAAGNKNALLSTGEDVIVEYIIDRTAPEKVEAVQADGTGGYVELNWEKADTKDIKTYKIYRADAESGLFTVLKEACTTRNYYDTSVETGKTYIYKVAAIDIAGNEGECSEEFYATVAQDLEVPVISGISPENGSVLGATSTIRVLAMDNAGLSGITLEYLAKDSEQEIWTLLEEYDTEDKSCLLETVWDTTGLTEGEYYVRAMASDLSGNTSEICQVTYKLDLTAPGAPEVSAQTGHFQVVLKLEENSEEDFAYYEIYRREVGKEDFTLLKKTEDTIFTDTKVVPNTLYSYKVAAYDKCGNVSWSKEAEAYADDLDTIAPVVELPENLIGLEGMEMAFDGMGSTDNVRITGYKWDMGNGDVLTGAQPVYTYAKAGTYFVTLEVCDAAGNIARGRTTVHIYEKDGRGSARVRVVDKKGAGIPYAAVYVQMTGGENLSLKADCDGYVTIAGTLGVHKVAAYANHYLPADISITISEYETEEYTLSLTKEELVVGDLKVRRMTLEEMVEAGVDFSAPENYNRFVFTVELAFEECPIPVEAVITESEGWKKVPREGQNGAGMEYDKKRSDLYISLAKPEPSGEPVEEQVPVLVYVRTTQSIEWLKEMFEVELGILNAADSEYIIEDSVATLQLPKGVSLAATKAGQSLIQSMGDIRGQERKSASWVVKGDESGSYKLSATFEGNLMPFNTGVSAHFETEESFRVSTGEGLHIYVMPEDTAYDGEQYYIQFALENKSSRTFYNLSTSFGPYTDPGYEYTITDKATGETYTEKRDSVLVSGAQQMSQSLVVSDGQKLTFSVLEPGDVYHGTYVTTFAGTGTEDVYYKLVDSLVEKLSGANTGVQVHIMPISGHIHRSYWGTAAVPTLYGDPIDITSGYFADEMTAFSLMGAAPLTLDIRYASGMTEKSGEMGYGWYHDLEMRLEQKNGIVYFYESPSRVVSFLHSNALNHILYGRAVGEDTVLLAGEEYSYGEYRSISTRMQDVKLVRKQDGSYVLTYPNGLEYGFDASGRLTLIRDTDGKTVSLKSEGNRTTVREDISGKRMYLNYEEGRLVSVSDDNGRRTEFTYDSAGRMSSLTSPVGVTISYTYDEQNRILTEANPQGVFVTNVYDDAGRVVQQTDATVGVQSLSYAEREDGGMTVTITDANGAVKKAVVDAKGQISKVVNENGGTTEYTYDGQGQLLCEKDAYGNAVFSKYDTRGNLVKVTDTGNLVTTMTYDDRGNVTGITNADGQKAEYRYDDRNRVIRAKDFNGAVTTYEYSEEGLLQQQTVEGLGTITYTYENGMPVSVTDYLGNASYTTYDGAGNLIKTVDALGGVTTYTYDGVGNLLTTTDSLGNTTTYTYDCNGNLLTETDAEGNVTTYTYDRAGRQTGVTYPDGTTTKYEYDAMGYTTGVIFPDGTRNSYECDASGNVVKEILADGTELTYSYDLLNRRVSERDKDGRTVTYEYYPNGNPYRVTYPDGTYELYTYNNRWRVASFKDTAGYVTSYEYDAMGNVTLQRDALGNTYRYEYDALGRLLKATDPNGNSTTYGYDANSNCTSQTDALGNTIFMEYDALNRMVKAYRKDKAGVEYSVSYTYDALGRVSSMTDEMGNTSQMCYDSLGNVVSVTDAKGATVSVNEYDTLGRVTATTDALGLTTTYSYDRMGNLLQTVEQLNGQADRVTTYAYDTMGRLTKVTDPLAGVTEACYDENGNVKSVTDANGGTTSYTYDDMGRMVEALNPIGSRYRYTYNAQGLLAELENARNQKTTYTYDAIGRVMSMTDELGTVSYTYDGNGNVLTVTDEQGTISRKYDALNRVTEYTDYKGNTVKYGYDELGNMISLTYPGGEIVRYSYYKNGLLYTVTDTNGKITSYEYDGNGNLTRTVRPNGTEEICTYNAAGLLTEQKDVKGEEVLTHYIYTYDGYGNVTAVEGTETTDTKEGIRNLTSATMTYDAANRLLTYNGEELQYDADGNMTYGPVDGEMQDLTYDCRNRLISAGGVTYTYDAENIRIKAETAEYVEEYVTDTVSAALSRVLTMTVYKKQDGVAETAGTTTTYLYGQGLIREETEGNYLYHHYNNLGSTMKLTDGEGQIVESYTYGVYGELLSGDSTLTHFLYNGRCGVSTDANGLYYMRQRYYNPEIKRFINQDILTGSLSNSQSLNRYSYVQGNPVSYTDPFGLSPVNGLFSNSNNIHGALTLAGFTPGPGGAIADFLDTLLYLLEGDIGGAIGAGIAIFASGLGLAYKTVKAVGKADKVSDTAKLVKNTVNAFSESGSFMKAASNGADAAQTIKAVKQGRVVDKLKDAKTAIKNKFNAKNISKLDLDDQVQGVYKSGSNTIDNRLVTNLSFENGERIATTKQIRNYKKQMKGMGINVVVDKKGKVLAGNKAAGFDYSNGTIYIKKKAGVIDLYHEGYHAEQYLNIGQENYANLGRLAREEYVYSRIMDNSNLFNTIELQGATDYIMNLRRRY